MFITAVYSVSLKKNRPSVDLPVKLHEVNVGCDDSLAAAAMRQILVFNKTVLWSRVGRRDGRVIALP